MDASDKNDLPRTGVSQMNAYLPRNVRFEGSTIGALVFGILILAAGLVTLVWLLVDSAKDLRVQITLVQDGRSVNGTVTESSVNRGGTYVKYIFTLDNVLYSGEAEMKVDHYTVSDHPRLISIRYLPTDPRVNQPADWRWVSVWDLFPFLLLITMTGVGAKVLISAQKMIELVRYGYVVVGRVTGCAPKNKLFTVFYVFESQSKEEIEGSCDLSDEYKAGAPIPIVYLRGNPKRNAIFPVPGFSTPL